jgi:hypothetical protein
VTSGAALGEERQREASSGVEYSFFPDLGTDSISVHFFSFLYFVS